jgi:hypothetical protein
VIIELILGAGLVAAGAAAGRALMRRRAAAEEARREGRDDGRSNDEPDDEARKKTESKKTESKKTESKKSDSKKTEKKRRGRGEKDVPTRSGPRGLLVDDVLLYADTELWLAAVIALDEEGFVARLFPAPGSTRGQWVAQLDDEARDLATLDETTDVPAGPVPESLPIGGRRVSLERRGDADVSTEGEGLPRTERRARYAILSDAGGRVLVVLDFDNAPRLALVGDRVAKHMVDLLPGGGD